jgi:hypothetical protein
MKPLERSQSDIIEHLETIIVEQNRRLIKANQTISNLKLEIEVSEEFTNYQINSIVEEYEKIIKTLLTPSLN